MATHSSILSWRIPMVREAWWATVHGVGKSQTERVTKHRTGSADKRNRCGPAFLALRS